jgi:hypothetical protein
VQVSDDQTKKIEKMELEIKELKEKLEKQQKILNDDIEYIVQSVMNDTIKKLLKSEKVKKRSNEHNENQTKRKKSRII